MEGAGEGVGCCEVEWVKEEDIRMKLRLREEEEEEENDEEGARE